MTVTERQEAETPSHDPTSPTDRERMHQPGWHPDARPCSAARRFNDPALKLHPQTGHPAPATGRQDASPVIGAPTKIWAEEVADPK